MTEKEAENAVELYSAMVYRIAFARMLDRSDAQDVYQEVFLRYFRKDPVFNDETHRKAWFIRVTVNCAAKLAGKRGKTVPLDALNDPAANEADISQHIELLEALAALPPKYREVIHLFYYCDMSTEEIARTLGRRRSTVTAQLSRARKKLKTILEEEV